jgi:hypothetical protein
MSVTAIFHQLSGLDSWQRRIDRYISNPKHDVARSSVRQGNIDCSTIFHILDPADWQFCARFDRGQLRSMAAVITSAADEYWRCHVDADGVFAVVPHIPSPQQQKHCTRKQQWHNNSHGESNGVFQFGVHH